MTTLGVVILLVLAGNQSSPCVASQKEWPPHEIAWVHYESQVLIISKDDEVAAVLFYKVDDAEHIRYAYRLLNKDGKTTKGKGELTMKWKTRQVEDGKIIKGPDRDFTTIKAGRITIDWYAGDKQKGRFWYVPESETVQLGVPTYFEDIELGRFRKKGHPNK